MVWELSPAMIVAVAVTGWGGGMRMARLALVVSLALFVVACSARQPAPGPVIGVSVRNHTNAAIDYVLTTRGPEGNGSSLGRIEACDVVASSFSKTDGQTWQASVNDVEVINSAHELPEVGPGQILQIVIDVFQDGEPIVGDILVRSDEDPDDQRTEGAIHAEVIAGLRCRGADG